MVEAKFGCPDQHLVDIYKVVIAVDNPDDRENFRNRRRTEYVVFGPDVIPIQFLANWAEKQGVKIIAFAKFFGPTEVIW